MSVIKAILEPHADGSLHLPLPPELRHGRVRVEARLEAADETAPAALRAGPEMLRQRQEAIAALRALGGLKDVLPDPASYEAVLRGNLIEWHEGTPLHLAPGKAVHVSVTVHDEFTQPETSQGQRMAAALENLARSPTFAGLDAAQWERDLRRERPLPGREEC